MIKSFNLQKDQKVFKEWINLMFEQYNGKNISVEIKQSKDIRSLEQNALYWGVVIPQVTKFMKDSSGEYYNEKEVHDFLKYNFGTKIYPSSKFYVYINDKNIISHDQWENLPQKEAGTYERIFRMPSTAKMGVKKFNQYIEMICYWCSLSDFVIEL